VSAAPAKDSRATAGRKLSIGLHRTIVRSNRLSNGPLVTPVLKMVSPLCSTAELAAALDGPRPPALLDVRWSLGGPPGVDDYRTGHLPGARFIDLDRELAG